MLEKLNLRNLKTLLISAKNSLNSQLSLSRTKNIKYTDTQYLELVSFLSLFNSCAEDGSNTMNLFDNVPNGDTLLQQLKKQEFETVNTQFHEVYLKQFYKLFPKAKKGKKYKSIVILDVHEQETYSKEKRTSKNIRGGKHKNGTNFFFHYLTMQVIVKDKILTLGVRFYRREEQLRKLVDELIVYAKQYLKIDVVLLDRGFRDVALLNNLEYRGANVLMPCVKDNKAEKCFEELLTNKNFAVTRFQMVNQKKEGANVTLLMIRLSNDKEIGFYTTIRGSWLNKASYYLDLYKKRWNIETGYRIQNMFLAKTTSIHVVVRFFYFCYAVAMHNLWLGIRKTEKIGNGFTVLMMKIILVLFWVTTHLPKYW